jgi:hypothetical protein
MVSSFANNRTLADIYLYARHLLFIFSSCFLHVRVHVFFMFRVLCGGMGIRQCSRRRMAGSSAHAAAGRRVLDQLVQLTGRCLMSLIQPERGGPGRRVW